MRSATACGFVFAGPPREQSYSSEEVVSSELETKTQTRLPEELCDGFGPSGPFELNSGGPFLINKKDMRTLKRPPH